MTITFTQLRAVNSARDAYLCQQNEQWANWSPLEWAGAMCGEAGEAANFCKKLRRGEAVPLAKIAEELADTVLYADLLAEALNLDLGQAIQQKFNVVSKRYGVEHLFELHEQ